MLHKMFWRPRLQPRPRCRQLAITSALQTRFHI